MAKKLSHEALEKFVSEVLNKREPCPAMVLAWGWMLKQGEGGVFHNDTYKQRYFVLARVPHATVLIYYGQKCMDEDHILGYIDLRRVTNVREATKRVVLDTGKNVSVASTFMSKLKGLVGQAPPVEGTPRLVLELVTSSRVFVLAPATIVMPPPMTMAMALGPAATGKPLYLFGWPFPVPALDAEDDEQEVATAAMEGRYSTDAFAQWRDVMTTAVAAEKATRVFPVMTLVDSSAQLPERLLLRTTPCELAIISVDDKDLAFAAVPYNDLLKWEIQVETELHLTARTRSRLVARPDRTGFASQRPTRPTCHFVFKSAACRAIVGVIDGHLRALAKQLGSSGADGGSGADYEDADAGYPDDVSAGSDEVRNDTGQDDGGDDEEDAGARARSLIARKPPAAAPASSASSSSSGRKAAPAASPSGKSRSGRSARSDSGDDDEAEEPEDEPAAVRSARSVGSSGAKSSSSKGGKATSKRSVDSGESSGDDAPPPPVKAKASSKSTKAAPADDVPAKSPSRSSSSSSSSKKAAKAAASDDDEEEEDEASAHKSSSSRSAGKSSPAKAKGSTKKPSVAVDDDEDEEDEDEEEAQRRKKAAAKAKAKKAAAAKAAAAEDDDE